MKITLRGLRKLIRESVTNAHLSLCEGPVDLMKQIKSNQGVFDALADRAAENHAKFVSDVSRNAGVDKEFADLLWSYLTIASRAGRKVADEKYGQQLSSYTN